MARASAYFNYQIRKPTITCSKSNGARIIQATASEIVVTPIRSLDRSIYLGVRLFDTTASVAFPAQYQRGSSSPFAEEMEFSFNAQSITVPAPSNTTQHSFVWQSGIFERVPSGSGYIFVPTSGLYDWYKTDGSPTYTVSVPAKDTYNITYYYKNGSIFTSTTGGEGDNHTVIAGTGIGGFDHWNTAADDTGTSYSPGATRFIDGDLYFYAICNGIVVRRKINGEWKNCSVQAKVNGEWVPIVEGYIKVDGVWKPIV